MAGNFRGLHRTQIGQRLADAFAAAGNFFHLGRHHCGHHEVECDCHQNAKWRRGDKPLQPGDGLVQSLPNEADRDHVLRGGSLDPDVPVAVQ